MKKWIAFNLLFAISIAMNSCKVSDDIVPDAHPYAKVVVSKMNTLNMGNSDSANVVSSIEAGSEVVKLRLMVKHTTAAQYIYILRAPDNGTMVPLPIPTTVNEYGTFTGGSSSTYSLKVPNLKNFTLDVAVSVRGTTTAALNDVYKIWITSSLGSFSQPAYNRMLGNATINLRYQPASLSITFDTATVNLGSQSSRNYGSFLSTSGQIAALDSALYVKSPKSVDIRLVTLTSGKKDNNSTSLWLYSPEDVTLANPAVNGQTDFVLPSETSRKTYFNLYNGTVAFDAVDASTLDALPTPSNKSIQVVQDGVYVFLTEEGKKGLIKINSTAATTNFEGTGSTTGQNATVTVKVLD